MDKSYTLFIREGDFSQKIATKLRNLFQLCKCSWKETDNGDIIIAIGGDGTFIKAVTSTNFSKEKIFVGVNTGKLGFFQNVSPDELDQLLLELNNPIFNVRKVLVPKITVNLTNGENLSFFALNEVLIAGKDQSQIIFSEYVNNELLQRVHANGICIASSNGDTALSMNLRGSIDFSNNYQLTATLNVPIENAAYERFIRNPIVCSKFSVVLEPSDNIQVIIDGIAKNIDSWLISSIDISMQDDSNYIQKFELENYSKAQVIRNKILGY